MKYLGIVIIVLATIGCSTNQGEEENNFQDQESIDPILIPYFSIVEALCNDDFQKAVEAGNKLSAAKSTNGVELALVRMGQLMSEASSLYDQRTILEQLGMVIPLHIQDNIINDYAIYKFKCINEFDKKEVIWFGISKKTKNPFIGNGSNECIELIETIEPVVQ